MSLDDANNMRRKILDGYVPTEAEMNAIIQQLIADRAAVLTASAVKAASKGSGKSRSPSTKIDLSDLMGEDGDG